MPLALSFVPTQSSAGAPSGWERSLSDVRVFRVRPPPPDVQSLGGRRFPCGSAGIEFEDAALRDKLQSPTRRTVRQSRVAEISESGRCPKAEPRGQGIWRRQGGPPGHSSVFARH